MNFCLLRVCRFASITHVDDIQEGVLSVGGGRGFVPLLANNNSKLCQVMAAVECQRRDGELYFALFIVRIFFNFLKFTVSFFLKLIYC